MSIETNIADSRIAFLNGNYEKALELANQAIALDPKSADAYQCAANAYMSFGNYKEAIANYTKALDNDADNGDRYFNLAYAYATDNQSVKALQMFAKADEVGCSQNVTGQLYKLMGMACFDMQRYNDAILNFIKAEKIVDIDIDILQRKALSYAMCGDSASAIEIANQIKLVAPTEYLGYRIAMNILLQDERFEEVAKELDRAERFAKPCAELFTDWLSYETTMYEKTGDKSHLNAALEKLYDGLCLINLDVDTAVEAYINAADIHIQLENADMALKCLNAAENPVYSFNEGFSVKFVPDMVTKPVSKPTSQEINHAVDAVRRKYGDRRLESRIKEKSRVSRKTSSAAEDDKFMTPIPEKKETENTVYKLDKNAKADYSQERLDRIYRLYVAAYTITSDTSNIKFYASKLANSPDQQSKYIGKYALIKAMKEEGYENINEEYQAFLKYLRNVLIVDPTDMLAISLRVQCYLDLGQFDEAEKLCRMLSENLRNPLLEKIREAKAGGES